MGYNELDLPRIEVVHQVWWTWMRNLDQYAATMVLVQQWNIRRLVIDRTGLGEGLAALFDETLSVSVCFGSCASRGAICSHSVATWVMQADHRRMTPTARGIE